MSKIVYGERIGKTAELVVACDGVIFDSTKTKMLLTQRADKGSGACLVEEWNLGKAPLSVVCARY